jgi:predicted AAA+ superfamily ATPase
MKQELFEKEYEEFEEYMRTLAMNTGNLFKSDGLAKVLGISRRKVNKYTEILMTHGIIVAL